MVFRRRDKLSTWAWLRAGIWPRSGWRRAIEYISHRLRRLPDTPEKIGRGMWCGVFASFTPFFGLHFILALVLARLVRGNYLASLTGTFFGNPLTFLPIGLVSMYFGYFLLGSRPDDGMIAMLPQAFSGAAGDLWHNLGAAFGPGQTDWTGLGEFKRDIFIPYLIGGLIPGVVVATASYMITVPLARAHQARRQKRLGKRLAALQKNPGPPPDLGGSAG